MSEYNTEKRISLDGIHTVCILNPVGRIEVTGWDEPDLLIEASVKSETNGLKDQDGLPVIKQNDGILSIRTGKLNSSKGIKVNGSDDIDVEIDVDMEIDNLSDLNLDQDLNINIDTENLLKSLKKNTGDIHEFIGKVVQTATQSLHKIKRGVQTSLEICLPKSMNLQVKNLNGVIVINKMNSQIRAKGINGPLSLNEIKGQVSANTVNGPVSLINSSGKEISLKSVNGPVKCYLNALNGDVSLKSVNGPIRFSIPENASAQMAAKTMHGAIKISSDFNQKVRSNRKVSATLNEGKHTVSLKTSTAAITILTTEPQNAEPATTTPIAKPPAPPKAEPQPAAAKAPEAIPAQKETNQQSPDDIIQRMLDTGKISKEEASRLRQAL